MTGLRPVWSIRILYHLGVIDSALKSSPQLSLIRLHLLALWIDSICSVNSYGLRSTLGYIHIQRWEFRQTHCAACVCVCVCLTVCEQIVTHTHWSICTIAKQNLFSPELIISYIIHCEFWFYTDSLFPEEGNAEVDLHNSAASPLPRLTSPT